jgi:hypothetical protein
MSGLNCLHNSPIDLEDTNLDALIMIPDNNTIPDHLPDRTHERAHVFYLVKGGKADPKRHSRRSHVALSERC